MGKSRKKATEDQEKWLLDWYNDQKEKFYKKCGKVRKLSLTDSRNLRELLELHPKEEFEQAADQMFNHEEYATNNGLALTPSHFLRPDNFTRYLTKAEHRVINEKEKKGIAEEEKQGKVLESKAVGIINETVTKNSSAYPIEIVEESKKVYSSSLEKGEWIGTVMQAAAIGRMFTLSFTDVEKNEFKQQAKEYKTPKGNSTTIQEAFDNMARLQEINRILEIAVKQAVKRKIKEPWNS